MRLAPIFCTLAAFACHTGSSNTIGAAVLMSSLALGSSAVSRANGGCYAVCQQGESCNQRTGYCEPLPCHGLCRTDESCEEGFFGIKCVPGPAMSFSSQSVPASTTPPKPKSDAAKPPVPGAARPPVPDAAKPPAPDPG